MRAFSSPSAAMPSTGKYKLLRRLGEGSQGAVYLAELAATREQASVLSSRSVVIAHLCWRGAACVLDLIGKIGDVG